MAWAETAADADLSTADASTADPAALDDDRLAKARGDRGASRRDLAGLLARTPYVLLLGIPGINVVSAAEFAGEMGPIGHYAKARAITGRAGLFPVAVPERRGRPPRRPAGPLRQPPLRQAILMIADNLIRCNDHFRGPGGRLAAEAGKDPRDTHVKVGGRFCRIAYQMVAGGGGLPPPELPAAGLYHRKIDQIFD